MPVPVEHVYEKYRVNVVVDNAEGSGASVHVGALLTEGVGRYPTCSPIIAQQPPLVNLKDL